MGRAASIRGSSRRSWDSTRGIEGISGFRGVRGLRLGCRDLGFGAWLLQELPHLRRAHGGLCT